MHPRHVAFLAAAAALLLSGCGATGTVASGGDVGTGKRLFQEKCAACHTLADAGSTAQVGPNLDDAFGQPAKQGFDESTIRDVVRGQIAYASPPMPRDLVTGADADAVASYVAQVAGKPVQGSGVAAAPAPGQTTTTGGGTSTTGGGGTTTGGTTTSGGTGTSATGPAPPGKAVFTANCASCHTLADAGATGTVGPNLDQLKPSESRAEQQVRNGGQIMPAFQGKLTDQQIKDVAAYVSSVAGGG